MTIQVACIVPAKTVENSQTTQYISTSVHTIIDKITSVNYSASAATISVNIFASGGSAGNSNLITKTRTILPGETYTFPEMVGQIMNPGDSLSTIAGTASAINIRVSGRIIS